MKRVVLILGRPMQFMDFLSCFLCQVVVLQYLLIHKLNKLYTVWQVELISESQSFCSNIALFKPTEIYFLVPVLC